MRWLDAAACAGMPLDVFFPDGGGFTEARRVCAGCRVRSVCLEWAAAEGFRDGMFGGVNMADARERRQGTSEAA